MPVWDPGVALGLLGNGGAAVRMPCSHGRRSKPWACCTVQAVRTKTRGHKNIKILLSILLVFVQLRTTRTAQLQHFLIPNLAWKILILIAFCVQKVRLTKHAKICVCRTELWNLLSSEMLEIPQGQVFSFTGFWKSPGKHLLYFNNSPYYFSWKRKWIQLQLNLQGYKKQAKSI